MPLLTALARRRDRDDSSITTLTGFLQLSSTTPALGTMLGLAVGIDYALFIMSRYQHEVRLRTRSGGGRRTCGRYGREVRSCSPD